MRLVSQNIMATPKMRYGKVLADLRRVRQCRPTVVGFNEMKWAWYWAALAIAFPPARGAKGWGRYPRTFLGARSSQPIVWDKTVLRKVRAEQRLLHAGGRFTEDRYMNAVLFEVRGTRLRFWVKNKHYLPLADGQPSEPARRRIWREANRRDRAFTDQLVKTGYPVFDIGDYNEDGPVLGLARWRRHLVPGIIQIILTQHPQLDERETRALIEHLFAIPDDELNTDHGGKVVEFDLD